MDRFLYLAMTGAKQALQAQHHNNHNLANANTTGFRADLDALLSAPVYGPGHPSRVYSQETGVGADFAQGTLISTGRDLDVAIEGDGWIAVQAPDGAEAYTRRGDLRVNNAGLLETATGLLVMGNAGPVAIPPAQKLQIGVDGTVSIVPLGQDANAMAVMDRIKLVKPAHEQMHKGPDGLFRTAAGFEPADGQVRLASGMLESSNVNTVDALVKMIDNSRQFETYVKLMSTAKENDESSSRLLRQS